MRKIISIILMTLTILSGCTNQSTYIEDIEALKEENLALKKDVEYLKNDFLKLESELNDTSENYNALTVDLENQFDSIFELRMKLDAYWMTYTTAE
ncbi:MAG: hypothetical protein PF505_03360 [Vallitaleaceae bacterium]|nr:hypothetical protein [Vallitaleaceae bacterium]